MAEKDDRAKTIFGNQTINAFVPFLGSQEKVARRIKERLAGVPESELTPIGYIDPYTSFAAGVLDGAIKIPYGVVNLTAEIADAFREDDVPIDESYIGQLEKYFDNSVLGKIQQGNEDIVKESAIGKLTSAFTQLYGLARVGASATVKAATRAKQIYNKYSTAAKANKIAKAGGNATKAGIRAKELNKLTGLQNFAAITIGGATGTSMIADIEGIGTFGDVIGGPSALDRDERKTTEDEAARRLWNRLKFGVEGAAISVPIAYGINTVAKRIAQSGKKLKYSDDQLDQWINKYIVEPFAPSGKKSQALFEGVKRVEGEMAAGQITARDLILDIDQTLYKIAKESGISNNNPAVKRLVGRLDELLTSTDDVISGGKITFKGFEPKKLTEFYNFLDEIGISKNQGEELVKEMYKVRNKFNTFKNSLLQGGNVNAANKEFMDIMSERMRNIFTSEYKIFEGKSILPFLNYKPTESAINGVKSVFEKYAKQNGIELSAQDLDDIITDVIKNVRMNPLTKTPEFPMTVLSVLDDNATQLINIADNVKGGQFKPTTLIQAEGDLRAFQRFFGQKRDLRNTVINTMSDLAALTAKDRFYNNIYKQSQALIAAGERAIVYPTRISAIRNLRNQNIIADKQGLQLKSPLGEATYTNPLNGQFTSQEFKDALQFSEKIMFDDLAKSTVYKNLVLIPKGLTQISKTILGPFTHARNFFTASQFALGTGNLFKDPRKIVSNFKQAFNTIQPQLIYRNSPKDQALYKFLLEEQVVSSSATARDIAGLLDDIGRGGDVYMRIFGRFGRGLKKLYEKAADIYVAEDDIWKTYNFLSEFDTYKNAYANALKTGKINRMPADLTIAKEVANIVRNTVPNYGYIGPFGQGSRRLPLGNFVSFPIEVTRTAANIAELGLKEARNPIFKSVGYKRLLGFATAIGSAPMMASAMLAGAYGVTKATAAAVREFLPSFSKDSTLFVYKDEKGNIKYIDTSGAMVYDTVVNPIQSVVAGVERENVFNEDDPLITGILKGLSGGIGRFIRPYVDESIYLNTINNLFVRKGITAEGRRLWNPDAPWGEKVKEAVKYALTEVAPLSYKQMERLRLAGFDIPGPRGEKYELSDELAGFYGMRPIKVDPIKSLNYKINDFKSGLRNTRSLFTSKVLKGGLMDQEDIIERYYVANQQRFKKYLDLKRKVEAAEILNAKKKDLIRLFEKRQESKNFALVQKNKFAPFKLTKETIEEAKRQENLLTDTFDELQIPAGITRQTLRTLFNMQRKMYKLKLNKDFESQISLEDFLPKPISSQSNAAPLPQQPMPNVNPGLAQIPQGGLTPTENALLSDAEKQIRLRQRGLA